MERQQVPGNQVNNFLVQRSSNVAAVNAVFGQGFLGRLCEQGAGAIRMVDRRQYNQLAMNFNSLSYGRMKDDEISGFNSLSKFGRSVGYITNGRARDQKQLFNYTVQAWTAVTGDQEAPKPLTDGVKNPFLLEGKVAQGMKEDLFAKMYASELLYNDLNEFNERQWEGIVNGIWKNNQIDDQSLENLHKTLKGSGYPRFVTASESINEFFFIEDGEQMCVTVEDKEDLVTLKTSLDMCVAASKALKWNPVSKHELLILKTITEGLKQVGVVNPEFKDVLTAERIQGLYYRVAPGEVNGFLQQTILGFLEMKGLLLEEPHAVEGDERAQELAPGDEEGALAPAGNNNNGPEPGVAAAEENQVGGLPVLEDGAGEQEAAAGEVPAAEEDQVGKVPVLEQAEAGAVDNANQ